MAKKKNKTGLMVILLIGGIIIGVIAAVLVMTMINKKTGTETKETSQIIETQTETETEAETFDPSTADDPVPTEEMDIAVIKVNDQTVTMREVNVYLYHGTGIWRMERNFMNMRKYSFMKGLCVQRSLTAKQETTECL